MITLAQYFQGRDVTHARVLGTDLRADAGRTVEAANKLLYLCKAGGVKLAPNAAGSIVRSGWRPADINATTPGASRTSLHMRCLAIDIEDVGGSLAAWCRSNADTVLRGLGLWLEIPSATAGWCHVQLKPPVSGNRVFVP